MSQKKALPLSLPVSGERDAHIVHFIVYITSFLNDRNIGSFGLRVFLLFLSQDKRG